MTHRFAIGLAIALLIFMAPRPAAADTTTDVFDTIDSVEFHGHILDVTGILSGQTAPTSRHYFFGDDPYLRQCEHSLMMMMSKPGKYRFRVVWYDPYWVESFALMLRTP